MRMLDGFARLWMKRLKKHSPEDTPARIGVRPPPTSSSWLAFMHHAAHGRPHGPGEPEKETEEGVGEKRPRSFAMYLDRGLRASDIPIAAIDFHCVPGIIDHLLAGSRKQSSSLQSAMWFFSSSRNTKKLVSTGRTRADGGEQRKQLLKLWAEHQRAAVLFQRSFIQSRFFTEAGKKRKNESIYVC